MHKRSVESTHAHLSVGIASADLVSSRLCSSFCGCLKEAH